MQSKTAVPLWPDSPVVLKMIEKIEQKVAKETKTKRNSSRLFYFLCIPDVQLHAILGGLLTLRSLSYAGSRVSILLPQRSSASSARNQYRGSRCGGGIISGRHARTRNRALLGCFDLVLLESPIERASAEAERFCCKKSVPLISGESPSN
jgi:hypothetical protein